jgi:C4-dicarboxylate transporter DctM subunit
MSGAGAALLGFAVMLFFIALRMPVGLAMLAVGSAGYMWFAGWAPYLNYMKTTPYHLFANYTLSVIPLFILMGAFAERSGLSTDLFHAASRVFGRLRGGLAMAVIGACTGFGAICGSSVATTATFGRAAFPELKRYGYDAGLSTATIAAGGTLGILIPPSVILVVYAISTEQNIAKLFQAALIPGLLATVFYCLVIAWIVARDPKAGPAVGGRTAAGSSLLAVWPAILVALTVLGGIYGGIFTPTEGASVGAVAMLLIGVLRGSLGLADIKKQCCLLRPGAMDPSPRC